jgi:hypothetical protein
MSNKISVSVNNNFIGQTILHLRVVAEGNSVVYLLRTIITALEHSPHWKLLSINNIQYVGSVTSADITVVEEKKTDE